MSRGERGERPQQSQPVFTSSLLAQPSSEVVATATSAHCREGVHLLNTLVKVEIKSKKNTEADRLVIGLEAIGYRTLSKFEPSKNAISTLKVMSAEERKRKNLELALSRYERAAQKCHSHWAAKWYKQQRSASAISYSANRLKMQW